MKPPSHKIAVALQVNTANEAVLTPRFLNPVLEANFGATIFANFLSSAVPFVCQ